MRDTLMNILDSNWEFAYKIMVKDNAAEAPGKELSREKWNKKWGGFFSSSALELQHRLSALHYGFQIALPRGSIVLPAIVFSNIAAAA